MLLAVLTLFDQNTGVLLALAGDTGGGNDVQRPSSPMVATNETSEKPSAIADNAVLAELDNVEADAMAKAKAAAKTAAKTTKPARKRKRRKPSRDKEQRRQVVYGRDDDADDDGMSDAAAERTDKDRRKSGDSGVAGGSVAGVGSVWAGGEDAGRADAGDGDAIGGTHGGAAAVGVLSEHRGTNEHGDVEVSEGDGEAGEGEAETECLETGPCVWCERSEMQLEYCKETGRRQEVGVHRRGTWRGQGR